VNCARYVTPEESAGIVAIYVFVPDAITAVELMTAPPLVGASTTFAPVIVDTEYAVSEI